jgi:hypothetical protein
VVDTLPWKASPTAYLAQQESISPSLVLKIVPNVLSELTFLHSVLCNAPLALLVRLQTQPEMLCVLDALLVDINPPPVKAIVCYAQRAKLQLQMGPSHALIANLVILVFVFVFCSLSFLHPVVTLWISLLLFFFLL